MTDSRNHHFKSGVRANESMKGHPRVGAVGERKFVVGENHAIDFAEGGMPLVLCTPWLIWFLEHAAREAVLPWLEPGESTVGLEIEVRHLAPTPLGHAVTCLARVIQVDGLASPFRSKLEMKWNLSRGACIDCR